MNEQMNALVEAIDRTEERFADLAPMQIRFESERAFALQVLESNSYLAKAASENRASLAHAIMNVASIGLSLNPAEKQAYLIPRNVNQGGRWITKVFLEPSYMGLCKLATDSGSIEWVQARCVYANDNFVDNGLGERPTHQYNAFSTDRGEFAGVYCVAKTHSGDYLTTTMPAEKINDLMERSESVKKYREKGNKGFGGPWITDFEEMAKKACVRNAFKMWPRSIGGDRLAEAVHLSNENEGYEPITTAPTLRDFTAEQKAYYDQLIEHSDAIGMYVFSQSLEETVKTNLYHSFERPKGKYQAIVDELERKGAAQFHDCIEAINAAGDDDLGVMEAVEDLAQDTIDLMLDRLTPEARAIIAEQREAA